MALKFLKPRPKQWLRFKSPGGLASTWHVVVLLLIRQLVDEPGNPRERGAVLRPACGFRRVQEDLGEVVEEHLALASSDLLLRGEAFVLGLHLDQVPTPDFIQPSKPSGRSRKLT